MIGPVRESARKPPLAKAWSGSRQKSMKVSWPPVTLSRRTGAAWEAAQKLPADRQPANPVTLMVRFDSERQKLFSAMQNPVASHWL